MKTHLRFKMRGAPEAHPEQVMKEMGITYVHSTPQSMGDQWWFWDCKNIPDILPEFLEVADLDPMKQIGYGLTEEEAIKIMGVDGKIQAKAVSYPTEWTIEELQELYLTADRLLGVADLNHLRFPISKDLIKKIHQGLQEKRDITIQKS